MGQFEEFLYKKACKNRIPLNGTFELSPVCNFSCKMCYVRKTNQQLQKEGKKLKNWKEWLKLAEECRDQGMLYLLLTGGEPFLYPDFKKLYIELSKMGFMISINSNAALIDDDVMEWLKKYPPHRMNVTLYGASDPVYQRITGNKNAYGQVLKGIKRLQEAGITIVINASMIPENQEDLEKIMEFGKNNNILVRVSTYMFPPIRREKEESDSRFTPKESADMFIRKMKCGLTEPEYRTYCKSKMKELDSKALSDTRENAPEYMWCRAGRSNFWVSWDGVMTACGLLPFPLETDPFHNTFKKCWDELTEKVGTTTVLKECTTCKNREICKPCAAMLYTETGDVNKKAPYLCEMTSHIIDAMRKEVNHE